MIHTFISNNKDFTLLHGNCMELIGQLQDNSIDAIFADPPYFLSNGGISVQSGKQVCVDKGEWDKGGTPDTIYQFNRQWLSLCRNKLKDNGTIWISGTHHNIFVVQRCLQELGYKILNVITWQKTLRLLYRIILASTNKGDVILDPFAGSSTTGIAANLLGRKFIGIEQDENFIQLSKRRRLLLDDPTEANKLLKKMRETAEETTVLINHIHAQDYNLTLKHGLCYLRAGDSKGSLLVQKGFEKLGYVLLHNNGENPQLFKLTKKGFQIWTAKALQDLGFSAENAPYYAVLRFDSSIAIPCDQTIQIKKRQFTNVAKICRLSELISIQ